MNDEYKYWKDDQVQLYYFSENIVTNRFYIDQYKPENMKAFIKANKDQDIKQCEKLN